MVKPRRISCGLSARDRWTIGNSKRKIALSFFGKSVNDRVFDKVGVAEFDPNCAFESVNLKFKYIVILDVQHDYEAISEAPNLQVELEVMR